MTATPTTLQQSLESELALLQQFLDILQAEAQALGHPEQDEALQASTVAKNTCIDQLLQAGHTREDALRDLGFNPDGPGLEAAIAAHPQLGQIGVQLLQLGRQASELNAANGIMINAYLSHTQQALQAIQHMIGEPGLYDASGRPGSSKGQRKTIKAG